MREKSDSINLTNESSLKNGPERLKRHYVRTCHRNDTEILMSF